MLTINRKTLHIINGEFYSGAERVQDLLAKQLPHHGYDVFFACVKTGIFGKYCNSNKDRIYSFTMRSRYDLRQILAIVQFVKDKDFSLIHSHTPRTALIASCVSWLTHLPMVHHVHSPTTECTENKYRNFINSQVERLALWKSKKNIAVSESLGRYLLAHKIREDSIAVIPNGVSTPGKLKVREAPGKTLIIGTLALFRPRKGLEILLHALANLKNKKCSFLFKAIGAFETEHYEHDVKNLAQKLGIMDVIEWTGFKKDVDHEFSELDLFILPSLCGEGTPMVILEAMALGVPVIASTVEGVPEVIRDNREGFLVPPGDIMALTTAIYDVMLEKKDWHGIRQRAYQRQVECYSDIRMAADVARVYDEVLKND